MEPHLAGNKHKTGKSRNKVTSGSLGATWPLESVFLSSFGYNFLLGLHKIPSPALGKFQMALQSSVPPRMVLLHLGRIPGSLNLPGLSLQWATGSEPLFQSSVPESGSRFMEVGSHVQNG